MTQEHRTDIEPAGFEAALPATGSALPPTTPVRTGPPPQHERSVGQDDSSGRAAQAADAGKQAAHEVASTATDKAKDVAQEAKRQTRDLVGEARTQFQEQASTQHQNAVEGLKSLATQLRSMSDNADAEGPATGLVGQAGDRVHSAASWLEAREPGQLVDEVRDFARRRPGAFLVGALVAGVVAGRLTRGVIDEHRDDSGSPDSGSAGSGTAAVTTPSTESTYAAGYTPTQGTAPATGYPATGGLVGDPAPAFDVPDQPATPGYGVPSGPRNPA